MHKTLLTVFVLCALWVTTPSAQTNVTVQLRDGSKVEGRYTRVLYVVPVKRSTLEVMRNYVEDLEAKRELLRKLEVVVADDAILATNTSSLSVTALSAGLRAPRPRRP